MIFENSATACKETPRSALEAAEERHEPQPAAQVMQQRPNREALLAEALRLIGAMSPELRQALADFVSTQILHDARGRIRRPRDISARVLVAAYLVSPSRYQSLAEIARAVGITRTMICRHAERFCTRLGFSMPPAPHPGNESGPRGAARANHEQRLARRSPLEAQADALLVQAGYRP